MHADTHKLGLVFGGLAGLIHLIWSALVAFGWAEAWLNFVLNLHFLDVPVFVSDFDLMTAATLVVMTAVIGYAVGHLAAHLWNWSHK